MIDGTVNKKTKLGIPLQIIKNRKEFQNNRVPQIKEEFKLEKVVVEENNIEYDGILAVEPIDFSAICEHHKVGISGRVFFAYIPNKYLIGLSQTARIIEYFMNVTEEILQEEATIKIVDFFMEILQPKSLWIVIKARHSCMSDRGIRQRNSRTTTSIIRGDLKNDIALRNEILKLWEIKI